MKLHQMRTCVGCRSEAQKEDLERFVYLEPEGLLHDLRQKAPGRGIWVHPRRDCLRRAAAEGGFSRAMKRRVEAGEPRELIQGVAAGIRRRQVEGFGNALRSGNAVVGQMLVQEAVKKNAVKLLVMADDVGGSTRRKFESNADRKGLRILLPWSGLELGQMAGREFVSIVGIAAGAHARRLMRDEDRWLQLTGDDG